MSAMLAYRIGLAIAAVAVVVSIGLGQRLARDWTGAPLPPFSLRSWAANIAFFRAALAMKASGVSPAMMRLLWAYRIVTSLAWLSVAGLAVAALFLFIPR